MAKFGHLDQAFNLGCFRGGPHHDAVVQQLYRLYQGSELGPGSVEYLIVIAFILKNPRRVFSPTYSLDIFKLSS